MLAKIERRILEEGVLDTTSFTGNTDELLDARDAKVFDAEWMRVYKMMKGLPLENSVIKQIDSIRENSFMRAYNLTKSGDIASCVSDDFEMICKAYVLNVDDSWIASLIMSYVKGGFPCGVLEKTECSVCEAVYKLAGQ